MRSSVAIATATSVCLGCALLPTDRAPLDTSLIAGPESAPVPVSANPEADEDPTAVLARDGRLLVVWSGKRNDGVHLRLKTSRDGRSFGTESTITRGGAEEDFCPSLLQARDGAFHLVWFRLERESGKTEIWYMRSDDARTFGDPRRITNDPALDWAPQIHQDADGVLWIAWSSARSDNRELFAVRSVDGGQRWSPPDQLTRSAEEDDFPQLVHPRGERTLVWTRYASGADHNDYWRDSTAEIVAATSSDGLRWSAPTTWSPPDTGDRYTEFLPFAFESADGRVFVTFTSDRSDSRGDIVLREVSNADAPLLQLTDSENPDYSGKVVPLPERGAYLLVWVTVESGNTDILARAFRP